MAEAGKPSEDLREERVLAVVVGAHLRAETEDRPLGYRLRHRIRRWQAAARLPAQELPEAVVCTDLWYLNSAALMLRPTLCVGAPEINAASAYLANRLPMVLVIDGTLQVQLDLEFVNLQACLWGTDRRATATAVDLFIDRYLDGFLRAAHGLRSEVE